MRGKDQVRHLVVVRLGITPAYAGKRKKALLYGDWNRDHPRICGEKERWQGIWNSGVGSPPRMRGKGISLNDWAGFERITPAYAGKSSAPP